MYKKGNFNTSWGSQSMDPTSIQLQTIGMRIRKAVSDGYSVPRSNEYMTSFEQQQQQQQQSIPTRVPLPSHMSQPPSLVYTGSSTLDSESFNDKFMFNTPQTISNKRSREDDVVEDDYNQRVSSTQVNNKEAPMEYFESKYGSLSFTEDF